MASQQYSSAYPCTSEEVVPILQYDALALCKAVRTSPSHAINMQEFRMCRSYLMLCSRPNIESWTPGHCLCSIQVWAKASRNSMANLIRSGFIAIAVCNPHH